MSFVEFRKCHVTCLYHKEIATKNIKLTLFFGTSLMHVIGLWGVGVADVVKALVHHLGIATVWVRVQAAATKRGYWEDTCTECAPIVQRRYKQHWKISMYIEN